MHVLVVGLGEDRAHRGANHLGVALGDAGEQVAQDVDPADRCQAAPAKTAPTAVLRPSWASEMTSCTPCSPRAFNERRNPV